jgi:hypothetical protein
MVYGRPRHQNDPGRGSLANTAVPVHMRKEYTIHLADKMF